MVQKENSIIMRLVPYLITSAVSIVVAISSYSYAAGSRVTKIESQIVTQQKCNAVQDTRIDKLESLMMNQRLDVARLQASLDSIKSDVGHIRSHIDKDK